ncbi:putative membrane protein [Nitrosomonas stercoris]|uniref:Putative membrane protein n=1 Tax=Nitrosomonas stercoris TaxID=1444684 RepID=A0A4Y1YP27_9PROT|nr:putative membrane protein [Nitrosomonas stercoris]
MGALAIITLAGSELLAHLPRSLGVNLKQITLTISLFAWALGTLWIPYLLVMDIQKLAGKQSVPLWITIFPWIRLAYRGKYRIYTIEAWSRVFPAGMYTACTFSLANTSGYYFLESISFYWCWFALLVWLFTLIGTIHSLTADENIR